MVFLNLTYRNLEILFERNMNSPFLCFCSHHFFFYSGPCCAAIHFKQAAGAGCYHEGSKQHGHYKESIADNGKDEISMLSNVFEDLMKQIMENQRRKDEFIGIASHELKTPLTSIKGYVELLESIEDKQPNKQFAQKALENINKRKVLQDLLDVSKIQSGQLELNLQEFYQEFS